jgi:hypothetical protein
MAIARCLLILPAVSDAETTRLGHCHQSIQKRVGFLAMETDMLN